MMVNKINCLTDGNTRIILIVFFYLAQMEKIQYCLLNAPGTFHDSTMVNYGMYDTMEKVYDATGEKSGC